MTNEFESSRIDVRTWQSVRTVLEGLILAGIIWLVRSTSIQSESIVRLQTQLESMQRDNSALSAQLAQVPVIARQVDKMQLEVDGHERRLNLLEQQPDPRKWAK